MSQEKPDMHRIIETNRAPLPIGPYAQAVQAGNLLFISGQIPLCPDTGELAGPDLATQTRQALANLQAVIDASGCTISQIVKTTIYLTDLASFAAFNRIYGEWLGAHTPARTTVQVTALPKGSLIEIDAIIVKENRK
jgi:2-iminobutanoate/2-iminopropanoate deaminase